MRILLLALSLIQIYEMVFSYDEFSHICIHGKYDSTPDLIDLPHSDNNEGRNLEAFKNFRIHFDYTTIMDDPNEFMRYLEDVIIPPTKNYWESTLKVTPMSKNLKLDGLEKTCNGTIEVPEIYKNEGVNADLVLFVDLVHEENDTFVAYTFPCALDSLNKRPVFGKLVYNTAKLQPSTNNVKIERDILVTLHETTHVLGFSQKHYPHFIDPITKMPLQGHLFTKQVNGVDVTVLNVEPLTTRLRKHFDCPTLEGVYLENQGEEGSRGQHFERRILYNEYMTSGVIKDAKVSEFTLALLEASGWYQVDYSHAEPITWGKGEGCDFLDTPCINPETKIPNFKEFCWFLGTKGISWTDRGGGVCGASNPQIDPLLNPNFDYWGNKKAVNDIFMDNCPVYSMYSNMDCEDEDIRVNATLPAKEFFGTGSKCFKGTLAPSGKSVKPRYYCFKPKCELLPNGQYSLKVIVGDKDVTCRSFNGVRIPGLSGRLFCPNVKRFCKQITSEGFCKRGCFGRGKCVNKHCDCDDGWGGPDCSKKIYVDNCKRCEGNFHETCCYGDKCQCNHKTSYGAQSRSQKNHHSSTAAKSFEQIFMGHDSKKNRNLEHIHQDSEELFEGGSYQTKSKFIFIDRSSHKIIIIIFLLIAAILMLVFITWLVSKSRKRVSHPKV